MELPPAPHASSATALRKSTNLNLIMRFYDRARAVLFDCVDLREASPIRSTPNRCVSGGRSLHAVPENIASQLGRRTRIGMPRGRRNSTNKSALPGTTRKSASAAGAFRRQRQRVASRALIRDPSLVVLDEATSALDPATEASVNETLERVSRGRTVVAVTHRLKSVVNYERVFVFKEGSIVEHGTHEELLRLGGTYAGMWRRQNGISETPEGNVRVKDVGLLRDVPLFSGLDHLPKKSPTCS